MCSSPPFSNPRLSLRRGFPFVQVFYRAIPHNSKCRYGERGAADAVPQPPERCLSRKAGIMRYCLESCLCLWNIRHFLCFQVHLKCKLINRGKHEPAFGFPVPSRSKTSKRPALLHGKIKKIREGRFPQLSHKIISSIKLRLPFPPWPAPSAALLGKCSCSARRSPHYANSRQGASSARR